MFLPKLVGTYEMEICALLDRWQSLTWDVIVDVGAAEGYYALQFARDFRTKRVVAFDTDSYARWMVDRNARRSRVDRRLEVASLCTAERLEELGQGAARLLLFVDIEGAEWELLQPRQISCLRTAFILVELHEKERPGVESELKKRFADTHNIEIFVSKPRLPSDFPLDGPLSDEMKLEIMNERRPGPMSWMGLTPKSSSGLGI